MQKCSSFGGGTSPAAMYRGACNFTRSAYVFWFAAGGCAVSDSTTLSSKGCRRVNTAIPEKNADHAPSSAAAVNALDITLAGRACFEKEEQIRVTGCDVNWCAETQDDRTSGCCA